MDNDQLNFQLLVKTIRDIHSHLYSQASKAINISLTLRNWLISMHIGEYELKVVNWGAYEYKLMTELVNRLQGIPNCNRRHLYRYLAFYRCYPQKRGTLPPQLKNRRPFQTTPYQLELPRKEDDMQRFLEEQMEIKR